MKIYFKWPSFYTVSPSVHFFWQCKCGDCLCYAICLRHYNMFLFFWAKRAAHCWLSILYILWSILGTICFERVNLMAYHLSFFHLSALFITILYHLKKIKSWKLTTELFYYYLISFRRVAFKGAVLVIKHNSSEMRHRKATKRLFLDEIQK